MKMKLSNFRNMDVIPACVWIIVSILVIIASYKLGLGKLRTPGTGMFPFLVGTILMLVSLQLLVQCLIMGSKKKKNRKINIWAEIHYKKIGMLVFVLFAYGLILEILGFIVTAFLCLFFLFKVMGSEKVIRAFLFASVTVVSAYVLFAIVLKVYMPSFPWRDFVRILF